MTEGSNTGAMIKSYVARIKLREEEREAATEDIKEFYAEAKSRGFDVAALRTLVKIDMTDSQQQDKKRELLQVIKTYADKAGINVQGLLF